MSGLSGFSNKPPKLLKPLKSCWKTSQTVQILSGFRAGSRPGGHRPVQPKNAPVSLVAALWASLKYSGTVITASFTADRKLLWPFLSSSSTPSSWFPKRGIVQSRLCTRLRLVAFCSFCCCLAPWKARVWCLFERFPPRLFQNSIEPLREPPKLYWTEYSRRLPSILIVNVLYSFLQERIYHIFSLNCNHSRWFVIKYSRKACCVFL